MYFIKTPWWLRVLYPKLVWRKKVADKIIYLTFDDGPHETVTPFVLAQLRKHNAKATFFCIGKNVDVYPDLYKTILQEGHSTANHTQHHLNGWKTKDDAYINDISEASKRIQSDLFRPPYGRIKYSQIKKLQTPDSRLQTIMWDVLSADFDTAVTGEACLGYVLYHTRPGSIVVFHDSAKAWERLEYALPKVLEHFTKQGYRFEAL